MNERTLQAMFRNWIKANWRSTAAFELKVTKTNRFNLNCIAHHQNSNLDLVNNGLFFFKFPDLGLQNPYDCFTLYREPAYVVIFFYRPRKPKKFYMIPIEMILTLVNGQLKSITEEEAKGLAFLISELK